VLIANRTHHDKSPVPKKGTDMAKKKKVIRRTWTKDDLRLLKSMAKDKQGVKKNREGIEANDWRNQHDGSKARYYR
jgi:hypothetical protein